MALTKSSMYASLDLKSGLGLTVAVFCLARIIQYLFRSLHPTHKLPPGPKPLPLIGNLHQLPKTRQWYEFYQWSKEYGSVMFLNMAGQPFVVLSSDAAAQDLLSRRGAQYSDRPRMVMCGELVTRGMHMLLRTYDASYRLHQRMEAPLLNVRAAQHYQPLQELESRQLIFDILQNSEERNGGTPKLTDFHHHFERAMASFIYCLSYGYRLKTGHEQQLKDAKHVQHEFARTGVVGAYLVDSFPMLNYLPAIFAPWKREGNALFQLEENLHVGNLEQGLDSKSWNFSKHYHDDCPEAKGMPRVEVAFDLGIMADAALDTSTVAMDWFSVAWAAHGSSWVAKAQALLDSVVGNRMPQFSDREQLVYIDAIVNETLRWRPVVVAGVPHATKTEDVYMGHRIPAGSIVLANHFAISRDEEAFGQHTDQFIPERWIAADGTLKDLPQTGFGFGRRICTGRHIARNGLYLQMARMLWAFDLAVGIDDTGKPAVIDDMAGSEGFVFVPKVFPALYTARTPAVRDCILGQGTTHTVDHVAILDKACKDRRGKVGK